MPKISRRTFLKTGAAVAATTVLTGCEQYKRYVTIEPYYIPPEEQLTGVPTWYASTCRMCSAGCGIIVRVMNGRARKIEGNPEHPLNRGKLCARGQAGLQLLYNPDRLQRPRYQAKRDTGPLGDMPWEQALDQLVRGLQPAGSKIAIWLGSAVPGHLFDLFGRFAKAVGAPAPVVYSGETDGHQMLAAGMKQLFGRDALPAYAIGRADVVLSFGADFLGVEQSPSRYGIEYGSFRTQPNGLRGHLVQFEPRQSITGAKADDWLPIRPGTEGLVALAIARLIGDGQLGPAERAGRAKSLAGNVNVDEAAKAAGISVADLTRVARLFAAAQRPLVVAGTGLASLPKAAETIAAVQGLNVVTGANAEGGLLLDADLPSPAALRPAPSGYADVQKLLDSMRGGGVQALLLCGVNPVHELPAKADLAGALAKVAFVASFTPMIDETAALSNLVLPERTYLESWGYTVVSPNFGLPTVSSQQPVVAPLAEARAPADVLLAVAKQIPAAAGALKWTDEVAFLRETIGQLPAGAAGGSGADVLWSRFLQHGGWWPAKPPAPAAAAPPAPAAGPALSAPAYQGDEAQFPYLLTVYPSVLLGRGAGANLPWLQGSPDPMTTIAWQSWVEIHPQTAQKLGVTYGDIVQVTSTNGSIQAPVYVYPLIRPDTIGIPLGQGHSQYGRYARDRGANALQLLGATPDTWATTRVRVEATGQRVRQAKFEWTPGVNQSSPEDIFGSEMSS